MASTTKAIPERSDVRAEDTWNLEPLFKTDGAWENAYKKLEARIPEFEKFQGTLRESAARLRACFEFERDFERDAERLGNYAFLQAAEDVGDSERQARISRYIHLLTLAEEAGSFVAPEIQQIPKKTIQAYRDSPELEGWRFYLDKVLRYRPHILSKKEERILAMQGEVADTAEQIFDQLNDADFDFGYVTNEEGEKVELSQGSFITLLESPKRSVRKKAFHQFYKVYDGHAHGLSAALAGSVKQDVYRSRVRNYSSSLEAALFHDDVPVSVYDSLIDAVDANLETVYRYLELRRKVLKIRDIHIYDCYVPLVPEGKRRTPYEQAVETICEALEPLGASYVNTLRKGLTTGRWVDRYENKGKRSGAFSSGGFDGPPYMLMNYKEQVIDSMFTLAHEAGHSMHTHYSSKHQPFQYYQYTIFVAEVASTFNEQLLSKHLLDHVEDERMRAFLINREIDEIRGTLVRQTMFAEFEKVTHGYAEAGQPLTLEVLRHEYRKLLERYFGPDFALDDELSLECFRIPHFYSAFYVYKYATGLSAAIALSQKVLHGGKADRKAYLNFLKSGGSAFPLDLLKTAGVDMTQPEPVNAAMGRLRSLVDELEALLT